MNASLAARSIYRTIRHYRNLGTDRIGTLPIVILMPHSACNCKCVMCDIWKGNHQLKQLTAADIEGLLSAFRTLGVRQVLMSGGEALLNPGFFGLCELLAKERITISLLSTGLTLRPHAEKLVKWVKDIIVSLDGDEALHDSIRRIPGAFGKLKEGIAAIHALDPAFPVSGRSVIHRHNFRKWPAILDAAFTIGLSGISFLPADTHSEAFNRPQGWEPSRQQDILPEEAEIEEMQEVLDGMIRDNPLSIKSHYIAESREKLQQIVAYYRACYGLGPFPYRKCNAPWVSTVIEADGTVRPCFFHPPIGNIRTDSLTGILNGDRGIGFRKGLDMDKDPICTRCVCTLNLRVF